MRRCGEPYLCDRKNHYALTDLESYSRLKPGGRKLASATAQARCLPDRYKQAPDKGVPDERQAPRPRQPGAQRRGRPEVSKRSVQTVANNTDVNVSLWRGVRRGYGRCLAPDCAPRVCPGNSVCPATDFHREASTCISSLPPMVGFGAPLSPRGRKVES